MDSSKRSCGHHARQMMVICSPLSHFLALWSSHCQVKNRPHGDDSDDPDYQICCFLWHMECRPHAQPLMACRRAHLLLVIGSGPRAE